MDCEVGIRPEKVGIASEVFNLELEFLWEPLVVGVEKGNPFAFGGFDGGVARDAAAGIFLVDVLYMWGVLFDYFGGGVCGTVVNDNDFIGLSRLGQDAVNRAGYIFFGIVGGYYSRYGICICVVRLAHIDTI